MTTNLNTLRTKYKNASQSNLHIEKIRLNPINKSLLRSNSQVVSNNNYNNSSGFFLTQKQERLRDVKKEIAELEQLLAGATQTSQSTLLLKKRKEIKEVTDSLELMKREYKKRMDECEDRRLQFELKQAKLREQVLKFEKFIHENDLKRQRAEIKIKSEIKQYYEKEILLNQLKNDIVELEKQENELKQQLESQRKYELYLEKIIEQGDYGYEEISDILNRYRTLSKSNDDVIANTSNSEKTLDDLRHQLYTLKTERQNQILVSNSLIQDLQKQLEHLRITNKENEESKYHLLDKQKDVSKELSQITLCVKNIYDRCLYINVNSNNKSRLLINKNLLDSNMNNNLSNSLTNNLTNNLSSGNTSLYNRLDGMLNIIHDRMIDFIEITNEYKHGLLNGNTYSNNNTTSNSGAGELRRDISQSTVLSSKS